MAKRLPIDDAQAQERVKMSELIVNIFLTIFGVTGFKKYKEDIQIAVTGLKQK